MELDFLVVSFLQDIVDVLVEDFTSREISVASRLPLERKESNSLNVETSIKEPPQKKMKLDRDKVFPGSLSLDECVCAYNALRGVLESKPPLPRFWHLLEKRKGFLDFVLYVSCGHTVGYYDTMDAIYHSYLHASR